MKLLQLGKHEAEDVSHKRNGLLNSRIVCRLASIAGIGLLAACSGGSTSDGTGSDANDLLPGGGGTGPDLDGILNDSQIGALFVSRTQEMVGILNGFPDQPVALLTSGNATFSGAGIIIDSAIPGDVDTVDEARAYALFSTDATAAIDFVSGAVTARQFDFRNVADESVPGQVTYSSTLVSGTSGTTGTAAAVTGTVGNTNISITGANDPNGQLAGVVVLVGSDGSKNTTGFFAARGVGGTYDGASLTGTFFAAED